MTEPRFADYEGVDREVLTPLFDRMAGWGEGVQLAERLAELPEAERNLLVAHCCFGEVGNGGFAAVFYNTTGEMAPEAVSAFAALGLLEAAECFALAIRHFESLAGVPYHPTLRDIHTRNEIINRYATSHPEDLAPIEEQDERFFELVPSEVFETAAVGYANTHLP